ncbi:TIGR03618 family F420-dependent PPOX class oxidoreductase [Kineosporia babensis]|uniref:TIGR03618 family F420-dependent PPOX class oxidoreductase n=1 Tax=Kineosporia babensis TaxID=499548 RepID=A0A9X1ND71_9ACTN|nr:TIGR03618 family F420-dependent PPOX class oxidoreductase [Kineosporia babensis]MCD5311948.1 TIGR03618 family F420-dependent PPOX class oxidoreductase [Kineosporia babensis]
MPKGQLPPEVAQMFARPNHAVMGTIHPDGYPVTVATWYLLEDDGRVLLNFDAARARLKHIQANPQVSLTALDPDNWYTHVSVQGTITEFRDDEGLADIDRLSQLYQGQPYGARDRPRVSAWLTVDRWHGWGAAARS